MKKVYVTLAAALMTAGTAMAQMKVGVEGGINLNNLANHYEGETTSNQIKTGFHAGIVTDFSLSDHFSVAPALRYIMKGGQEERNYNGTFTNGSLSYPAAIEEKNKLSFHYIELPVNIVYKTGMPGESRFMIGAGPYVAYMVNAQNKYKTTYTYNNGSESIDVVDGGNTQLGIGEKDDDVLKALDYGAQAFIGYQAAGGAFAKVGSSVGFANTLLGGNSTFYSKNYNFFLTVGYMFGGK